MDFLRYDSKESETKRDILCKWFLATVLSGKMGKGVMEAKQDRKKEARQTGVAQLDFVMPWCTGPGFCSPTSVSCEPLSPLPPGYALKTKSIAWICMAFVSRTQGWFVSCRLLNPFPDSHRLDKSIIFYLFLFFHYFSPNP